MNLQRYRRQRGATFMEFIFAVFIIVFTAYGTIELTRILTFKNKLHTVAVDIVQQVAHQQLYLEKLMQTQTEEKVNAWLNKEIRVLAKNYLSALENAVVKIGLRVNPEIVREGAHAGIYLQLAACYSFAFTRYQFIPHKSEERLQPFASRTRNCFGEVSLQPTPQMQVYERAYAPWPASTLIYRAGLPEGREVMAVYPTLAPPYPGFYLPNVAVFSRETPRQNSKLRIEEALKSKQTFLTELLEGNGSK